jgi:hypothetical protein
VTGKGGFRICAVGGERGKRRKLTGRDWKEGRKRRGEEASGSVPLFDVPRAADVLNRRGREEYEPHTSVDSDLPTKHGLDVMIRHRFRSWSKGEQSVDVKFNARQETQGERSYHAP